MPVEGRGQREQHAPAPKPERVSVAREKPVTPTPEPKPAQGPQGPSVGLIVRYHTVGAGEARAAIVAGLAGGSDVDLVIFNRNGSVFVEAIPFSDKDEPGHWARLPRS